MTGLEEKIQRFGLLTVTILAAMVSIAFFITDMPSSGTLYAGLATAGAVVLFFLLKNRKKP